jgi:hypothetical protein
MWRIDDKPSTNGQQPAWQVSTNCQILPIKCVLHDKLTKEG